MSTDVPLLLAAGSEKYRQKREKKMRKAKPVIAAVGLLLMIALGVVGVQVIQKYTPS